MKERRFDWLMFTIVLLLALLGAILLYFGAKDKERIEETRAKTDSIRCEINKIDSMSRKLDDSLRHELRTLEDSVHFYEDGM